MATGEFEGKSLGALHAMVANADPALLSSRGEALGRAGTDMDGIGSELRTYIERVEWDGEGADAFREWGQQFALETMRFAAYVRTLGQHMVNAGQALTEAKAAIPEPEGMCYADPEKDKARKEAEEAKRQEAINQLSRLSSYYRTVGESMRAAEEPDFKPLQEGAQKEYSGTNTSGTASGGGSRETAAHRESGASSERVAPARDGADTRASFVADRSAPPAERPAPVVERPAPVVDRPVGTTIDSVAPPAVNEAPRPQTAGPVPSQSSTGPAAPPVAPLTPTGPLRQADRTSSRTPVSGRSPVVGGGGVPPRGPGDSGITGGTNRQTANPAAGAGTPRGIVAGGNSQAPVGRPFGGLPGGVGGGAPANGGIAGRPMASQPGGVAGTPRTGSERGRTSFTPGGTGLVRGGAAPGVAARPASTSTPQKDRRRGHDRPDYLSEDEETWAVGQRNVVPPVID